MYVDERGNPEPKETRPPPDPPEHLDPVAAEKWREFASPLCVDEQDLFAGVWDALEMYCVGWSRWTAATAKVQELGEVVKSPSGYPIQNPWLAIANKAFEQTMKAARRLQLPY